MKTTIKTGICMMMLSFAISACMKEELKMQTDNNKYYDTEIFIPVHEQIYGSWSLSEVSDRYGTVGSELDVQQIEILPVGRFMYKSNGQVINTGKIVVDKQASDILLVTFYSDDEQMRESDIQKYIEFINGGTMFMKAQCCSGRDYTFSRMQ